MKTITAILIAALLFASPAHAGQWTSNDQYMQEQTYWNTLQIRQEQERQKQEERNEQLREAGRERVRIMQQTFPDSYCPGVGCN
jgi:hypothetical protein